MSQRLLLLAALLLCCCIASLQALPRKGCTCIRTITHPPHPSTIMKVEVIPPSGRCRQTERIIIKKNGSRVCVSPDARWFLRLLQFLEWQDVYSTPPLPTASTVS